MNKLEDVWVAGYPDIQASSRVFKESLFIQRPPHDPQRQLHLTRKRVAVFLEVCATLIFAACCASGSKPNLERSMITPVVETALQESVVQKTDYVGRSERFGPYVDADQVVVTTYDGASVMNFDPTAAVDGKSVSKAH